MRKKESKVALKHNKSLPNPKHHRSVAGRPEVGAVAGCACTHIVAGGVVGAAGAVSGAGKVAGSLKVAGTAAAAAGIDSLASIGPAVEVGGAVGAAAFISVFAARNLLFEDDRKKFVKSLESREQFEAFIQTGAGMGDIFAAFDNITPQQGVGGESAADFDPLKLKSDVMPPVPPGPAVAAASKAGFQKAKQAQAKARAKFQGQDKQAEADPNAEGVATLDATNALDSFSGVFGSMSDTDAPVSPNNEDAPGEEDVGPR